jgi:SAM-dependent methyltransferase
VFIELAEALDCPVCRDGYGLVAFVRDSDRRRVITGHLGCPICEIEFSIASGTIDFGSHDLDGQAPPGEPISVPDPALATKLAALLGLGERPGLAVLLGAGLGGQAAAVARMADRAEVIALASGTGISLDLDIDDLAAGIDPVTGLGASWPVRRGALDGVAWRGPVAAVLVEVSRCLREGGRFVIIDPDPVEPETLLQGAFEPLATDHETWVGARK